MGNGPGGLQRQRRRLELLHPRPGPLARLPLGRRWVGRYLRRPSGAVLRAGSLERARSDPEGAGLRPGQQRRQSRRGRQGVLLLYRLDADALVHEVPVQVSAGCLPVQRPGRNQPQPGQERARIRVARHRRVRREPLLRRLRRICEGGAGRRAGSNQRLQPRARPGPLAPLADAVVPQHLVAARGRLEAHPGASSNCPAMQQCALITAIRCSRKR